jgi:hypothetical protein
LKFSVFVPDGQRDGGKKLLLGVATLFIIVKLISSFNLLTN